MGNSHYKSNLIAYDGTQTLRKFASIASMNSITATDITALTSITVPTLKGTTKVTTASLVATNITGNTLISGPRVTSAKVTTADLEATLVEGFTSVTTPNVIAESYVTVGTNKYIFTSNANTAATIDGPNGMKPFEK